MKYPKIIRKKESKALGGGGFRDLDISTKIYQ